MGNFATYPCAEGIGWPILRGGATAPSAGYGSGWKSIEGHPWAATTIWTASRELVQTDQEGRCVVLPCMIGDTVYVPNHHLGRVFENEGCWVFGGGTQAITGTMCLLFMSGKYGSKTFRRWKFQRFGKTVFLTREEAEAALREEIADER